MRCVVDGQELEYEERGEGRPIVFIHGLTTDHRLLLGACDAVFDRPGLRRIYLSLPGHGGSTANLVGAHADALVAAVRGALRALGAADAPVVAHSYGAYLTLGVLRDLPSLAGLFLICPVVQPDLGWRNLPPQRYAVIEDGLTFEDDVERNAFDAEVSVYTRETLARFRRDVMPGHRVADRFFVERVRARYSQSPPLWHTLRAYRGLVHILCGHDDYWAGYEDAAHLARAFVSCDLHVLPGCGHFLPVEKPAALATALTAWLEGLPAS